MKIKLCKRYKTTPLIEIETKKYCFVIMLWNTYKWGKWEIKKGFSNKTFKFHPFEMTWYF